jgi:hypothetical protein
MVARAFMQFHAVRTSELIDFMDLPKLSVSYLST